MKAYDTVVWAERRRPLEILEAKVVQLALAHPDPELEPLVDALRYVLSFARLTAVRNRDGVDVDVMARLERHAAGVRDRITPAVERADSLWDVLRLLPDLVERTRQARATLLEQVPLDRDSLEAEVTTRVLAVANGGGGGAGYVYPGAYEMLERAHIEPSLMVGTSIGSLMALFRCRRRVFELAPLVEAARTLSWARVFRVLESQSRYGLPATLRLYLRDTLGPLFQHDDRDGRLEDLEIPLYVVSTGITVTALQHGLAYYEDLLATDIGARSSHTRARGGFKVMNVLREFLSNRNSLREVVLGRDSITRSFDILDAAGFSSAIPGVIHYDVLRDDPRMTELLDTLYAEHGITRLGEGGLVSNVPARIAWESVVGGDVGRRNAFVIALDCFAPNRSRIAWYPFQQLVHTANVAADLKFAEVYVPSAQTLSPLNLVPALPDAMKAIRWGRDDMRPHMPFVKAMMTPLRPLE